MAQYTLLLLEVTGIQEYIFGSNHLAQNIGASELVYRVTTEWVVMALDALQLTHNTHWDGIQVQYYDSPHPQTPLQAEVVYAGGGNAMLLFAQDKDAKSFVHRLSNRVLREAPGLQLVAMQETFNWTQGPSLAETHQTLRRKLAARKRDRPISVPLPGLGVTAGCVFTGLPAVGLDDDPDLVGKEAANKAKRIGSSQPISAEVAAKLRAEQMGKERLKKILPEVQGKGFEFVYDFGDFGDRGESSHIAVIHADGNQMGKRFGGIADAHVTPPQNRDYIHVLRQFSQSIAVRAEKALCETTSLLFASQNEKGEFGGVVKTPRRDGDGKPLLPFRPIVFGGDDITFVCDGRLGLAIAAKYLQTFTEGELSDGKPVFARAGIAVVKSHYPFSRAYQLAEDLAKSAKKSIEVRKMGDESSVTVLDWHFAISGVLVGLEDVREREYRARHGKSLLMRPLRLSHLPDRKDRWQNWETFTSLMRVFQRDEGYEYGEWTGRRNKVKALREPLREGPSAVRLFRENYDLKPLPDIPGQPDMSLGGWQGDECGYFDAIEAIDFFVELEPHLEKEAA